MKRSNIIFFTFITVAFIAPFILMGVFYFFPTEGKLIGFGDKYRIIMIENTQLKTDNIIIGEDDNNNNTNITIGSKFDNNSYVYYKGKKRYIPSTHVKGDTLYIEKPQKMEQNEELKLYINIKSVKKIYLNNREIWGVMQNGSSDEYTYVPSLTDKINAFVKSSVSLQDQINTEKIDGKNVESVAWVP